MSEMHPFREYEMAYAGVGVTFCRTPLVLDPAGLAGVDVAIVGAPFDLGTSFRPGARFGPRAIRMAEDVGGPPSRPSMELGLDPFGVLRVVDHGDCAVFPEIDACHAALQRALAGVLAAGAVPVVLGGDHSLSLPHPLHRPDAHLDGFGNHGIDAAWSLRSFICLEQDTGMGEPAGRRRAACDGLLEKLTLSLREGDAVHLDHATLRVRDVPSLHVSLLQFRSSVTARRPGLL